MFTHALKRSTWSQIGWNYLAGSIGETDFDHFFSINGGNVSNNLMDYLLAVCFEAVFPRITLANTPDPVPYTTAFLANTAAAPTPDGVITAGEPLYFYLSDGSSGLPAGTVFVGSLSSLTGAAGLGLPADRVAPFISYSPRHRVGWGHYALIAAIEQAAFSIDFADYEVLSRHAIFNALQFRTREDVYPVSVEEATSFDAILLPANVGMGDEAILGSVNEDERYKAVTLPFSFTTSALADRGENGKHKSAFPVLLACRNSMGIRVNLIDDLRRLLVLEEEVLPDYSIAPVTFVATAAELAIDPTTGAATSSPFITNGTDLFGVQSGGFILFAPTAAYATTGNFTVVTDGTAVTYGPTSPFTIGMLGAQFLEQTGEYLPITRPSPDSICNPFSMPVNYADWIVDPEAALRLNIRIRALGASVTQYERGMMKSDCRSKKYLYERYWYEENIGIVPGATSTLYLNAIPGAFKYAYTFAQNELSRLQGQFFNYTNDTDYSVLIDEDLGRLKYNFQGRDSLAFITSRIRGEPDESHPALFYRYVDNPLFAQRAPRDRGLHIAPRYANWINSIYPDGSINPQAINDVSVSVRTTPSGLVSTEVSPFFNLPNTYAYNVMCIGVSWQIALFELYDNCDKCARHEKCEKHH
jgi:hypothetical protein